MISFVSGRIGLGASWQSSTCRLDLRQKVGASSCLVGVDRLDDAVADRLAGSRRHRRDPDDEQDGEEQPGEDACARASADPLLSGEVDEDEDHEPDEGERLGEGDAEEHRGADHAGGLGLAGHGGDGVTDDDADADARADGGEAVDEAGADGRQAVDELAGLRSAASRC